MNAHLERRIAEGADPDELMRRLDDIPWDDVFREAAQPIHNALLDGLPQLIQDLGEQEHSLEQAMTEVWGPADDLYRAAAHTAYELGGAIATARRQHSAKIYALLGAHGRAVRIAGEVRHLAMSGFAAGATARWRSLHDLAVVCLTLQRANDEISERYLAYSQIELWKDMQDYQKHAAALGRVPYSAEEHEAARAAAEQVVEQWGSPMRQLHGWAAPLFPTRRRSNSKTSKNTPSSPTGGPSIGWATITCTPDLARAS